MDLSAVLWPVLAIGGMGLFFGTGLGIAARKFAVPVDEKAQEIKDYLPGANCGGCGMAGCEAMAKSIAAGSSRINACPVCSQEQIEAIGRIMGIRAETAEKKIAVLRCKGSSKCAKEKYEYRGLSTCQDAHLLGGGPKMCSYGCLGYGSCMAACPFGAITMKDGLPHISRDKCTGCGACEKSCPRQVIHLVPADASYHVNCISRDKGKEVRQACTTGCIGCGLCVKQCEAGAISLKENYAEIDISRCTGCGRCSSKCPTHAISNLLEEIERT